MVPLPVRAVGELWAKKGDITRLIILELLAASSEPGAWLRAGCVFADAAQRAAAEARARPGAALGASDAVRGDVGGGACGRFAAPGREDGRFRLRHLDRSCGHHGLRLARIRHAWDGYR